MLWLGYPASSCLGSSFLLIPETIKGFNYLGEHEIRAGAEVSMPMTAPGMLGQSPALLHHIPHRDS